VFYCQEQRYLHRPSQSGKAIRTKRHIAKPRSIICQTAQHNLPKGSNKIANRLKTNCQASQSKLSRPTEQNFFSGSEIYFKSFKIYFQGFEIYFQALEIVLFLAAKDLCPDKERFISLQGKHYIRAEGRLFKLELVQNWQSVRR